MMHAVLSDAAVFDGCRARIEEMLEANAGIDAVESTIDAFVIDREHKDALWLWACGRRDQCVSGAVSPRTWP